MNMTDTEHYDYDEFRNYTLEGNWEEVAKIYKTHKQARETNIDGDRGTALHVAVNDGLEDVVKELIEGGEENIEHVLKLRNERGDTPLHLAAKRGFKKICKLIIGQYEERKLLIKERNVSGETPLFLAALSWRKRTFAYLFKVFQNDLVNLKVLIRDHDGDTILHSAIRREFFDLAVIIINYCPKLNGIQNKKGMTPLKLLANRPSAFRSGCKLTWWRQIKYNCIVVQEINAKATLERYYIKEDKPGAKNLQFPENYRTCYEFSWFAEKLEEESDADADEKIETKETAFLIAARNGILEIVKVIANKIPSAIYDTTTDKMNVFHVAVKNRQSLVVEFLQKNLNSQQKNNLIQAVDKYENTVLHLAAETLSIETRPEGSAMQMMWEIKWFEYVKKLLPDHFILIKNKRHKTSGELFKESHKMLVNESSSWFKEISAVVAALVAGVAFATVSTIPGWTEGGKPALEGQPAFDAFVISSLIALVSSVTALILFLSLLTSQKQAQDFRRILPALLLSGLTFMFLSIVAMFVSFCTGHFFLLNHKYRQFAFPIYVAACLPVAFYAVAQFPLYLALLNIILWKVPKPLDI